MDATMLRLKQHWDGLGNVVLKIVKMASEAHKFIDNFHLLT